MLFGIGSLLLGILILVLTVFNIGINNIIEAVRNISIPLIIAFFSLSLLTYIITTLRWKLILNALGYRLGFPELFQYNVIGFSIGYITPVGRVGGAPARMLLLNQKKVPVERGLASVLLDNIIENSFDVLFAIILLSFFFLKVPIELPTGPLVIPTRWRLAVLGGSIVLVALISVFYYRMLTSQSVFYSLARLLRLNKLRLFSWSEQKLHDVDRLFSWFLRTRPKEMIAIFVISCLSWVILLAQYRIALLSLGQSATFFELLMIMGVLAVVTVAPVPAGIGVLELGQAGIFALLGLDPRIGIAFALLIRLRDFVLTLLGSGFLLQIGMGVLSRGPIEK